jgi:hypothetical protein
MSATTPQAATNITLMTSNSPLPRGLLFCGRLGGGSPLIVARMTGKRVGVDTATRMLKRGDE